MALYVSSTARLRRTLVMVVIAALLAFLLGWLYGRQQVPSIESRVTAVQATAADIATGVERLDIEYEQVLAGGDSVDTGVIAPLTELRTSLVGALDDAPWIAQSTRNDLLDSFTSIESAARQSVPLDAFRALLSETGTSVRTAFGAG
jgi:hypothetical protein